MLDKKYQIFISSTYTDLVEARMKVRDAILSMYHFPVGMELFGAANEEQWQIISETIDSSDYYILIVGQRYGSVIPEGLPDAGMSYTEKEFHHALGKGIPVLAFIIDDNALVKKENIEEKYPEKLKAFKEKVKTGRLVEWWKTSDELAQKVTVALYKQITRTKRPGWIRGDAVDVGKSLKAITELTQRNQQLVDENRELLLENQALKHKTDRKPKLIITFEGANPGEKEKDVHFYRRKDNISTDENELVHLKVGTVNTDIIGKEYLPVSNSDFVGDLSGQVSDKEIKAYNEALPSKKALQEYLDMYRAYHMIVDHGIASTITIHNIGTAKATDISFTVEFPKEIQVLNINEVEKLSEPKAPKKPRNLQEIAYERAYTPEIVLAKTDPKLDLFDDMIKPLKWPKITSLSFSGITHNPVVISHNKVSVEPIHGIVHTKSDSFTGLYIVPFKKGFFRIKVTLMCAEYEQPDEMEIIFVGE